MLFNESIVFVELDGRSGTPPVDHIHQNAADTFLPSLCPFPTSVRVQMLRPMGLLFCVFYPLDFFFSGCIEAVVRGDVIVFV